MKRINIMGLCLVAAFAFSALVASAAQATVEQGQCRLLTKNTNPKSKKGKYADENCLHLYEKKGKTEAKGNYEWYPGPGASCIQEKKGNYSDSGCTVSDPGKGKYEKQGGPGFKGTTGKAELSTSAATVTCTGSTALGEEVGLTHTHVTVTFAGCESARIKCSSKGQSAGTIQTLPLETTYLGFGENGPEGKSPATLGEVWVDFTPASGSFLAEFSCGSVGFFKVSGNVSGEQTGDINTNGFVGHEILKKGVAEQNLKTEICAEEACGTVLDKNLASVQATTGEVVTATNGEIKAF